MTHSSVIQGAFTLERHFPVPRSRLFQAWSDKDELSIWAAPAPGWTYETDRYEFRVGGVEISRFGPPGEEPFQVNSRFDDIMQDQRIVTAFSVARGVQRISSTVLCVEFHADRDGARLVLNETGMFFEGRETPDMRRNGTLQQIEQLGAYLSRAAA
ncbi:MAG: SRPBCC domain-containing protein [Hyphomicrobiaceae bacterium]|nr:SRPBCC domain-containing protein [Hyphomicrobiaceae bacterium]MCC0024746.1 SRPBCC domain-containing protein [Hyphomicrobiaceae bacterium]